MVGSPATLAEQHCFQALLAAHVSRLSGKHNVLLQQMIAYIAKLRCVYLPAFLMH